jgi:hypothetical protein
MVDVVGSAQGGADLSECSRYRYRLWRDGWSEDDRACLFVMLNPSTADAMTDDPTIRKCVGFCKRWGFGRLFVVNLFAYRSTSPDGLLNPGGFHEDADEEAWTAVGPDNDAFVTAECAAANRIVLAWGSHRPVRELIRWRVAALREIINRCSDKVVTLGFCKDGSPRHPLMLAYATEPQKYAR